MPRPNIKRYVKTKSVQDGSAIKNFVNNVKSIPHAFVEMGKATKEGRLGKMLYNDMNPMGKKVVDHFANAKKNVQAYPGADKEAAINRDLQSMGYRDIQDFYDKHPESNFDSTDLLTKGVRKVKNIVKRYIK